MPASMASWRPWRPRSTCAGSFVRGDKAALVGFGNFEALLAKPRTGHIPRTGEKVDIGENRRPKFTAGRTPRAAVAGES